MANLLPGFLGLYAAGLMLPEAMKLLEDGLASISGLGPVLLVVILSLLLGLFVGGVRTLIYEDLLFTRLLRVPRPSGSDLRTLVRGETLAAYRAAVEELYRYHQFWGSLSLTIPFLYAAILTRWLERLSVLDLIGTALAMLGAWAIAAFRAFMNYRNFNKIEVQIMKEV